MHICDIVTTHFTNGSTGSQHSSRMSHKFLCLTKGIWSTLFWSGSPLVCVCVCVCVYALVMVQTWRLRWVTQASPCWATCSTAAMVRPYQCWKILQVWMNSPCRYPNMHVCVCVCVFERNWVKCALIVNTLMKFMEEDRKVCCMNHHNEYSIDIVTSLKECNRLLHR